MGLRRRHQRRYIVEVNVIGRSMVGIFGQHNDHVHLHLCGHQGTLFHVLDEFEQWAQG